VRLEAQPRVDSHDEYIVLDQYNKVLHETPASLKVLRTELIDLAAAG
jgi:hypothetical protein